MREPLVRGDVVRHDLSQDPYAGSHGASQEHLGAGALYYAIAHAVRSQVSVCLGSGGGFVPTLMRRAQLDAGLSPSATYLVDANLPDLAFGSPGVAGGWMSKENTFARREKDIVFLPMLTVDAAKVFAAQEVTIDYLHIDANHSVDGVLDDFMAYAPLLSGYAVVTLHDLQLPSVHMALSSIMEEYDGWQRLDFSEIGAGTAVLRRAFLAEERRPSAPERFVDEQRKVTLDLGAARSELEDSQRRSQFERWAYLRAEAYQVRYTLLASFVDKPDATIVEIGGYPNSIIEHLSHARCVHLWEPYAPEEFRAHIEEIAAEKGFSLFMHPAYLSQGAIEPSALGRYSLVCAGLDVTADSATAEATEAALRTLSLLAADAQMCAFEVPGYGPSQKTWELLDALLEPTRKLDVTLDLSNDPAADRFHVKDTRAKRRIVVFEAGRRPNWSSRLDSSLLEATAEALMEHRTRREQAEDPEYVVGDVIDFSLEGTSQRYTRQGWRGPERTKRWAVRDESVLCFVLLGAPGKPLAPTPLRMAITLVPFLAPGHIESQRLTVSANGDEVWSGVIATRQTILVPLSAEAAFRDEVLRITLVHPDAGVPGELIPGKTDKSQLAIGVESARIDSVSPR